MDNGDQGESETGRVMQEQEPLGASGDGGGGEDTDLDAVLSRVVQFNSGKFTFLPALRAVLDGKRITRAEWGNEELYVVLHEGILRVKMHDGLLHDLILRDVDLYANDWRVL